jgi:cation diffusion facilitator CzcD-associated flavoprotein CzcO
VVGAGAAGLGVAAELIARGVPGTLLDSGSMVGSSWA